ncbi:MAG: ThiF family adenylyltransferase [Candidatus Bathyarchaeia archaeon]
MGLRIRARLPSVEEIELELKEGSRASDLKSIICARLSIEPEATELLGPRGALREEDSLEGFDSVIVDYLWARQMMLWGREGQSKIRGLRVVIAGAGAIGNELAKNLAMLGVGEQVIIDYDQVEESNLNRAIFFREEDIGRNKADALAERVNEAFPLTRTLAINDRVEAVPLGIFLNSDAILSGLDNALSRIYLSQVSRKYLVPLIDGGIIGSQIRVQTYIPPDSPCPACALPPVNYKDLAGLRNPCAPAGEEAKMPSLPTSASLAASIQAQELVKIALGYEEFLRSGSWPKVLGKPLEGVLIVDLDHNRYSVMDLKRSERCLVCGKGGLAERVAKRVKVLLKDLRGIGDLEALLKSELGAEELVRLETRSWVQSSPDPIEHLRSGGKALAIFKNRDGDYEEAVIEPE